METGNLAIERIFEQRGTSAYGAGAQGSDTFTNSGLR